MVLTVPPDTGLRPLTAADAPALFAAIEAHRASFDPWLRWSSRITSPAAAAEFIAAAAGREARGDGFHLGLWRGDALLGGVACWWIDTVNRGAEVGYWLVPGERGRGLADRAVRAVLDRMFLVDGIHRVEFLCRVENGPSRRLAERVGGRFEGIRREARLVDGAWWDHAVYAVLDSDPGYGAVR